MHNFLWPTQFKIRVTVIIVLTVLASSWLSGQITNRIWQAVQPEFSPEFSKGLLSENENRKTTEIYGPYYGVPTGGPTKVELDRIRRAEVVEIVLIALTTVLLSFVAACLIERSVRKHET
jgi:hypothetical protein